MEAYVVFHPVKKSLGAVAVFCWISHRNVNFKWLTASERGESGNLDWAPIKARLIGHPIRHIAGTRTLPAVSPLWESNPPPINHL